MRSAAAKVYCDQLRDRLAFFHSLTGEDMCDLLEYLDCRKISAGGELWREGDAADFEAFIFEGKIEEQKMTEFGRQVVIGVYHPGTIVGEVGIIDEQARAVTALAQEETFLLILTREKLLELLAENPTLAGKVLQGMIVALSVRLRKSFARLAAIF
jgi:CRP-like cAMP-binding protein